MAKENPNYEVLGSCLIERKTKKIISGGIDSVVLKDFNGIGCNAFFKSKIERIEIPKTVEEIDTGVMYGADSLKTIVLNEGLKTIGSSAFDGTAIKEISIPSTVQKNKGMCIYGLFKTAISNFKCWIEGHRTWSIS